MSSAYWTLRTAGGSLVLVEYNASLPKEQASPSISTSSYVPHTTHAHHSKNSAVVRTLKEPSASPHDLDGVDVVVLHAGGEFRLDDVLIRLTPSRELVVNSEKWRTSATTTPSPYAALNPGKVMLDIEVLPEDDVDSDLVAPHGLIGQSFDRDDLAVDGRRDRSVESATAHESEVSTEAQAEGAIEGVLADYEVPSAFATEFRFSRFNLDAAPPRNVALLTGLKRKVHKETGAGRSAGGAQSALQSGSVSARA